MEALLASSVAATATVAVLLLAGLLLVFLLLRSRLDLFDRNLASLAREVRQAASQPPPQPPAIELPVVDLAPIEARLDELRRLLDALHERLGAVAAEVSLERSVRLHEMIERRFRGLGFESIRILSDLAAIGEEPAQVNVEVIKGGSTRKGYVVIDKGRVVGERLSSSYEVFP